MTATALKLIALITMTIDHIHDFIPGMPCFFKWIGRISAPIFTYCCVLGFVNTSNKKKYMMRLYLLSSLMGVINNVLDINYNFIRTLLTVVIIIYLYEGVKNKEKNSKTLACLFVLWQVFVFLFVLYLEKLISRFELNFDEYTLSMMLSFTVSILSLDGGFIWVFIGLTMYFFQENRNKLAVSFILIDLVQIILCNTRLLTKILNKFGKNDNFFTWFCFLSEQSFGVHPAFMQINPLYGDPQWMMIFSLPFMCMYNGERGMGLKKLFYIYYPLHIVVLFLLGKYLFI